MFDRLIFVCLSIVFLMLGLATTTNRQRVWSLKFYVALMAILPFSGVFSTYWYQSGVATYDLFWFGVSVTFVMRALVGRLPREGMALAAIVLAISIGHALVTMDHLVHARVSDVLKDLKPVAIASATSLLVLRVDATTILAESRWMRFILVFAFVKTVLLFAGVRYLGFAAWATDDPFFAAEADMRERYLDFAALFALIYLTTARGLRWPAEVPSDFFALAIIYLSGSRSLLLLAVLVIVFPLATRRKDVLPVILAVAATSVLFLLSERVILALEPEVLARDLGARYAPFLPAISDFQSMKDLLVGLGVGYAFYIPWFDYRATIDPLNNFLDNAYLTAFAKYGCLMFLFMGLVFAAAFRRRGEWIPTLPLLISLLILGLTNSIVYQHSFAVLALWWAILTRAEIAVSGETHVKK